MTVHYAIDRPVSADQFIALLTASTLGARRPVEDRACMQGMLDNADLTVTAWDGDRLVGMARSITDFHYACYLSDLAVHVDYQRTGIGRRLQELTQSQLGPRCKIFLFAAPAAEGYYGRLGYTPNPHGWVLERGQPIGR